MTSSPERCRRRSLRHAGLAGVAVLGLVVPLGACGDDDGPDQLDQIDETESPDTEAPVITDPEGVTNELDPETEYQEEYGQFDPEDIDDDGDG